MSALLGEFESGGEQSAVGDSDSVPTAESGTPHLSGTVQPFPGLRLLHSELNLS